MRLPKADAFALMIWRLFIVLPCLVCLGAVFYEFDLLLNSTTRSNIPWSAMKLGVVMVFAFGITYKTLQALISTGRNRETEGHFRDTIMKLFVSYLLFGLLTLSYHGGFGLFLIGSAVAIFLIPDSAARS